ncbi:MAG: toll/interleukin-1 receptor domain-containing protein [Oscillospiraceae bacterium]|nr:toll/interleukin-1 receptor domain-containing protein [Oscillospiraceae bacterium]
MSAQFKPLSPYEGNEPYVFVSYSHGNKQEVSDIIAQMQKDGYRVWYDEGVTPGREWAKYVAERLRNASCCISMISGDYLNSSNCLDEMEYARDLEKNRFLIYLTRTPLPPDLQLRHNRNFAIHKYRLSDAEFYNMLYSAEGLVGCSSGDTPKMRRVFHPFRVMLYILLAALLCAVIFMLLKPAEAEKLFHLPKGFRLAKYLSTELNKFTKWFRHLLKSAPR